VVSLGDERWEQERGTERVGSLKRTSQTPEIAVGDPSFFKRSREREG